MSYRKAKIPDLDNIVHEYVLSNNTLGGTVTDASIANAATEPFQDMVAAGRIEEGIDFKASEG